MNTRLRVVRSIPFWALLVVSLASLVYGVWITLDKLSVMTATLQDQTATGVEVYGGQAWVVFGAAFVAAGVIGLLLTLAVAVIGSLIPAPAPTVVETIDWTSEDPDRESPTDAPAPVIAAAPETAPAPAAPEAPAAPAAPEAPAAAAEPAAPATPEPPR